MLAYMMSGIEMHLDFGFGMTADSYYMSANHLKSNPHEFYNAVQQREMPANYLFRHSIELYLKSLIIIFHKKLEINYDQEAYGSVNPKILTEGNWRPLYTCHWIDELYDYWLNSLLLPNVDELNEKAPIGDWSEAEQISKLFPLICKYDRDSSFFRYPKTKNTSLDKHKFTMKRFSAGSLTEFLKDMQDPKSERIKGRSTFIKVDENDQITDAYVEKEKVLEDVSDGLYEIARYFYAIHTMTRVTLCGGM